MLEFRGDICKLYSCYTLTHVVFFPPVSVFSYVDVDKYSVVVDDRFIAVDMKWKKCSVYLCKQFKS